MSVELHQLLAAHKDSSAQCYVFGCHQLMSCQLSYLRSLDLYRSSQGITIQKRSQDESPREKETPLKSERLMREPNH